MFKRIFRLPYFPLVITPLVLFSPLLFAGKALFWGTPSLQFVPWWSWAWETILEGHLPLWNPLLGMGAPLIANYQSALFYPPNWIYFLFYVIGGIGAMTWAQSLVVVLHLIWAGLGMAALVRRLGMGVLPQAVSGLAFSLSGYLVARAWFASINAAVAWLPWVMLFAYDVVSVRDRRAKLRLGLVIGLQLLAGHAQTTWYTLILTAFWLIYWGWELSPGVGLSARLKSLVDAALGMGLSVIIGIGLSAVQLFPTAVYLMQSQRVAAVYMEFALNYSFWPWRFLGLVMPGLFGSPATADYWGYGNYWEDAIYIGLLPILLAVRAMISYLFRKSAVADKKHRKSLVFFLASIALVSFLLALGKNTPIYPWLYQYIPTFDMFQAPARFSIWAVFALALMAGIGVENWRRPIGRSLYWSRLGTAGALAVSLGAGLAFYTRDVRPTFIRAMALAGVWAFGIGILALAAPRREAGLHQPAWWLWAVAIWLAADLLVAGWGLNPGIDLAFYTESVPVVDQVRKFIGEGRVYLPTDQEEMLKYQRFLRFDSFELDQSWLELREAFLPNLSLMNDLPSVNNFDPLVPGRYAQWMASLESADSVTQSSLLDLMGATVYGELDVSRGAGVRYLPWEGSARWRWVPCAIYAEDEVESRERVFSGEVDFESKVILEGVEPPQTSDCSPAQGQVLLEEQSPNRMALSVEADTRGWVVLSDAWYPGWQVAIDGQSSTVQRANFLFRAVEIPPGNHLVEMIYRPIEFYLGLMISVFAWCYLVVSAKWNNFAYS